ncbi:MAG: hypothetical protein U0228_01525 [Myxococcaceae bacterium]
MSARVLTLLFASFVVSLVGSACTTSVGIPCEVRDECEPGQDCFQAPGGFCTRGCSEPGQTRECPAGTICTFFVGQSLVCSPTCEVDRDCRVNFECALTHTGGTKSACRPAPP